MSINKSYAVFGLGRYGAAVARELLENGAEVLVVDSDRELVEDFAGEFPVCKCADITDAEAVKQLGISNFDTVIIAIAGDFEACVLATMHCKEAGVEQIIVKCSSDIHKSILERIGADSVVFPEKDSGIRLAKKLLSSDFVDIATLSDDISIVEINVKPEWAGKTLGELELRKKHFINVIAIKEEEQTKIALSPDMVIRGNTKMIAIGNKKEMEKLK